MYSQSGMLIQLAAHPAELGEASAGSYVNIKLPLGGWRDGSEVKSIACSTKGPDFNSQQPHGCSQPSVMGSGALFWPAGIDTEYCTHNK